MKPKPKRLRSTFLLAPLVAWVGLAGCTSSSDLPNTCTVNAAVTCGTILAGDTSKADQVNLVGFSCTGSDRPDEHYAKFVANIPKGMICAEQGATPDGSNAFCCTPPDQPVACALNPIAICPDNNYGFQCYGADRPEALNPALTCGNGVREGTLIDYCCSAQPRPAGCTEAKGACNAANQTPAVPTGLTGWKCPAGTRPRGEDFGANESRADYYYFVCDVPTRAPNGRDNVYCCFSPSPVLPGGSCVYSPGSAPSIPNCGAGHFAFACYGRDRPDEDYTPRISCKTAPVSGLSDTGYAAQLYCCDYVAPGQGSGAGTDPNE